jgi:multidrug resistance efflux pump
VLLITVIFYNHPSTTNVTLFFRTVPIVPETIGRVAEVYVGFSGPVAQGAPIFRLDSSKQEAALETAKRKIAEVEAALAVAKADVVKAEGQVREARGNVQQAQDELDTKLELQRRELRGRRPADRRLCAAGGGNGYPLCRHRDARAWG